MSLLDDFTALCSAVTPLAQGGQKVVLSANHPEWGDVVVKHGDYRYGTSLERITREVGLLREIQSPYYPKQYEFLVEPAARQFLIVEERLAAKELGSKCDQFGDDQSIINLLASLVVALEVLWDQNVVHRDLKPANILITEENEPRIIDLGIARFLDENSLTANAAAAGPATHMYAAPEQLLNKKSSINPRTDFFLLGILVFELSAGFHPFDPVHVGNQKTLPENIVSGSYAALPSDGDGRISGFIERALKPQPYQRFRNSAAIREYLGMEAQS